MHSEARDHFIGDQEFDETGLRDETGWDLGGHIVQRVTLAALMTTVVCRVYAFHCLNIPHFQ
jgi:hypothetical protein